MRLVNFISKLEPHLDRILDSIPASKFFSLLCRHALCFPRSVPFHYLFNQKIQRVELQARLHSLGIKPKSAKVWWPRGRADNFGDLLTHYILAHVAGIDSQFDIKKNFIAVGSVIRLAENHSKVWGSGIIRASELIKSKPRCLAVRGPLTRERLLASGVECPPIYGDPALLLPLIRKKAETTDAVRVVPHFKHFQFIRRATALDVIDLRVRTIHELEATIDLIASSKKVITSSLHAFILSVAYQVPVSLFSIPGMSIHGDDIKFRDFSLGAGADEPKMHRLASSEDVDAQLQKLSAESKLVIYEWDPLPLLGSLGEIMPTDQYRRFVATAATLDA